MPRLSRKKQTLLGSYASIRDAMEDVYVKKKEKKAL